MDKTGTPLSRYIPTAALDSFSLGSDNPEEIAGTSLFPYLVQTMDAHDSSLGSNDEEMSKPDLTARTLLAAAERVLLAEGGKLHVKDLQEKMIEYGLIPQSAKSLANLESILYRETFSDNSKFKRIEGRFGWFALVGVDVDDMDSDGSTSDEDQSESMDTHSTPPRPKQTKPSHHHDYKHKYCALRKMVKELIFLNAATSDDISRTEAKLTRAKAERKFLLKRLFQYQAVTEAGVLQPHSMSSFHQDSQPPITFPEIPIERPKQTKLKVKKTSKVKDDKVSHVKGTGQHIKSKNSLQAKLTQAKLTAQARNLAKLTGQNKVSGHSKSSSQSKSPSQSKTSDKVQATPGKTVTHAKMVVQAKTTQPPKTAIQLTEVPPIPGAKEKKSDKSKSSRPKTKKAKNESPQTASVSPNQSQVASGDSAKPKRKKPGTAIKRKVQPIPVDPKGKPIFPIVLGGLTVHSLGEIVWDRPGFHSERYIWPVGYCSSRTYPSITNPEKKCIYTCKILDGGFGPQFEMCPEDDPDHPINASSATACHCVVLKTLNKARGRDASNTGSGPEFFGYSHPTIQYLIQNLPGAKKCNKYHWVKFELPKPQSKQGGKLSSACSLNLDIAMSPNNENTPNLSSSSSQDSTGLADDSAMEQDDSNLTLHSSAMTDNEDDIFEDIDIPTSLRPLTLASSNATLSSQRLPSPLSPSSQLGGMGTDNDIDTDIGPLMSSPTRTSFSSSLPITLSPPSLTSPSSTVTGNGSFMMPLASPLFDNSSGFSSSVLPDLSK